MLFTQGVPYRAVTEAPYRLFMKATLCDLCVRKKCLDAVRVDRPLARRHAKTVNRAVLRGDERDGFV